MLFRSDGPKNASPSQAKRVDSPPSRSVPCPYIATASDSSQSWAQVVQGHRRFRWEMPRPTIDDISALEARFFKMVVFSKEEIQKTAKKWQATLVGKFLGQGLPLEFVQKEIKTRWQIEGDFKISPLSEGFLVFCLPSEEIRSRVLELGPWTLAGQLLALECW